MKSQSGLKLRGGINIVSIFTPMSYIKGCGGWGGRCPKLPKWFLNSIFEALKICFILAKSDFWCPKCIKPGGTDIGLGT